MEEEKLKLVSQLGKRCRWKHVTAGEAVTLVTDAGTVHQLQLLMRKRRWFNHSYRIFESPWPV